MKSSLPDQIQVDYHKANSDNNGHRNVTGSQETVQYPDSSSVRIWYNQETIPYDFHWHTALEIIMPVENYYDVETQQASYHINPDEILLIPPMEMHRLIAPESGVRFIYLFDTTLVDKLRGFSNILPRLGHFVLISRSRYATVYEDIRAALTQMRNEYFKENQYAELSIFSLLLTIYAKLGYYSIEKEQFPSRHPLMQKEYTKKFNEVLSYIDAHYADNLALDDMADFVGFSKFYFCRLFRQYTGLTFKDYLNFRRLKVAEEPLADRTLSITDISQRAGFSNISTFNRLFKTARQCTPSDYRSKYAGNLFSK